MRDRLHSCQINRLGLPAEYHEVVQNIPEGFIGSEFVRAGYDWYGANYDISSSAQRGKNGAVFEGLVLDALYQAGIRPAYYQAKVIHIPTVVYDILLYHPRSPVVLSCKVSLRERWKQADYEGEALRRVYRGSRSVLLTLSDEGIRVQKEIEALNVVGLDECLVIKEAGDGFDQLIQRLQNRQESRDRQFRQARPEMPVNGRRMS